MSKDYSEYERSAYEKYLLRHMSCKEVRIDYFMNKASFYPKDRTIHIHVDGSKEDDAMEDIVQAVTDNSFLPYNQERYDSVRKKYSITLGTIAGICADETGKIENPMINIFSGSHIKLKYGEGLLDFIYADFLKPYKDKLETNKLEELLKSIGGNTEKKDAEPPKRILSSEQHTAETYLDYADTFIEVEDIAYASLYSAICPPVFDDMNDKMNKIKWYVNYLVRLQKEYTELLEFCFDKNFYPELLGKLYPSERLALYRRIHDYPYVFERSETLTLSSRMMHGNKMPYGLPVEELLNRYSSTDDEPTKEEIEFSERYNIPVDELRTEIQMPHFISVFYEFSSVHEMLELEFTKLLESDIRFRKCKRCGKYFIMKGNYDTNYCNRTADGETRTCQEMAAQENYKKKMADNAAIALYQKYYKRYSARVKVRQIKESEFKKWKYAALTMRDECTDGKISAEEYVKWLEGCFPNRGKKS